MKQRHKKSACDRNVSFQARDAYKMTAQLKHIQIFVVVI